MRKRVILRMVASVAVPDTFETAENRLPTNGMSLKKKKRNNRINFKKMPSTNKMLSVNLSKMKPAAIPLTMSLKRPSVAMDGNQNTNGNGKTNASK